MARPGMERAPPAAAGRPTAWESTVPEDLNPESLCRPANAISNAACSRRSTPHAHQMYVPISNFSE